MLHWLCWFIVFHQMLANFHTTPCVANLLGRAKHLWVRVAVGFESVASFQPLKSMRSLRQPLKFRTNKYVQTPQKGKCLHDVAKRETLTCSDTLLFSELRIMSAKLTSSATLSSPSPFPSVTSWVTSVSWSCSNRLPVYFASSFLWCPQKLNRTYPKVRPCPPPCHYSPTLMPLGLQGGMQSALWTLRSTSGWWYSACAFLVPLHFPKVFVQYFSVFCCLPQVTLASKAQFHAILWIKIANIIYGFQSSVMSSSASLLSHLCAILVLSCPPLPAKRIPKSSGLWEVIVISETNWIMANVVDICWSYFLLTS